MELRLPLELSPGREAACRAVFGTWGFFRTMHGKTAPSCGLHSQAGVRRGVRASGSYQEGTGKSGSYGTALAVAQLVATLPLPARRAEAGLFLADWGKAIPAWTDLPLVPLLDGLVLRLSGESRTAVQAFTTLLFAGSA